MEETRKKALIPETPRATTKLRETHSSFAANPAIVHSASTSKGNLELNQPDSYWTDDKKRHHHNPHRLGQPQFHPSWSSKLASNEGPQEKAAVAKTSAAASPNRDKDHEITVKTRLSLVRPSDAGSFLATSINSRLLEVNQPRSCWGILFGNEKRSHHEPGRMRGCRCSQH
jgi:hypothetical protein